jgi:hypothetical protein
MGLFSLDRTCGRVYNRRGAPAPAGKILTHESSFVKPFLKIFQKNFFPKNSY